LLTLKELTMMKRTYFSAIALTAALAGGQVLAAETSTSLTRDQVKAELAEAVRTGNILANDPSSSGKKLNEINPSSYPAQTAYQGKTRAQVNAELTEAVRTGNILASDLSGSGKMLNQINPSRYPAQPAYQGKTRTQVKAELAEAVRTGNIVANDPSGSGKRLNEINPARYNHTS